MRGRDGRTDRRPWQVVFGLCWAAAAAAALTWSALVVFDAARAQDAARQALAAMTAPSHPAPSHPAPLSGARALRGAAIATLSIPRLALSTVVLHGSDDATLRDGPGHIESTAFPGEPGNVAIAGHRDTFFRPLRDIAVGDDVFLDTPLERIRYRVARLDVVGPRDLSVLKQSGEDTLTLITCYPFWVLGPAPDRFIVRAARVAGWDD
jgi:sortase A